MRLDQYISEKTDLSKNKAQALIKSENIKVNGKIITKVGLKLDGTEKIEINKSEESKYVARSALKLKYFLEGDIFDITGFTCLDIGSSTGGFCQVLLEKLAGKIYAVDVGSSQLHESIKDNYKVISIENTDIRKLKPTLEKIDLITCDVSFISLEMIIDSIISHMSENTIALLLFKPQFEVGKQYLTKKGVVKNEKISEKKLNEFLQICRDKGLKILKVENSRLKGEEGNKEIVLKLKKRAN